MDERLIDENTTVGYTWYPWAFDMGDIALFMPPLSHKEVWADIANFFGMTCVVMKRYRGISTTGIDDEYDVLFKYSNEDVLIQSIPSQYLINMSRDS